MTLSVNYGLASTVFEHPQPIIHRYFLYGETINANLIRLPILPHIPFCYSIVQNSPYSILRSDTD